MRPPDGLSHFWPICGTSYHAEPAGAERIGEPLRGLLVLTIQPFKKPRFRNQDLPTKAADVRREAIGLGIFDVMPDRVTAQCRLAQSGVDDFGQGFNTAPIRTDGGFQVFGCVLW